MRRAWLIAAIIGAMSLPIESAIAGGAPVLRLNRYKIAGEQTVARITLYSKHKWELRDWVEGGPFYAYVSPGWGKPYRHVPPLPDDAQLVAPMTVGAIEPVQGLGRWRSVEVRAEFTMPKLAPGRYRIDACTNPCTRTIDGIYAGVFRIVAGPVERRIQRRLDRVADEASYAGVMARRASNRARQKGIDLRELSSDTDEQLAEQGARIDELGIALQRAGRAANDRPFPVGVAALAWLAGAATATAGWFFGRKAALRAGLSPKKEQPTSITTAPSSRRKDRHALGA